MYTNLGERIMTSLSMINELGLDMNAGECLEHIKTERQYWQDLLDSQKKNSSATFDNVKRTLRSLQAYDFVIKLAEKHLNHEK